MGRVLFATVLLAGILYGSNTHTSANDKSPANPDNSLVQNDSAASIAMDNIPSEPLEIAAVDYCYAGSLLDPTTGESVELFVLCEEDGLEQNIDLA
jgi:hypothetical protein